MVSARYIMAVHPFTSVRSQTWRHLKCVKCFELKKNSRKSSVKFNWKAVGIQGV